MIILGNPLLLMLFFIFFSKECLPSFGKENGCVPINHYCHEEGDVGSN